MSKKSITFLIIFLIIIVGCGSFFLYLFPLPTQAPEAFPETDIIFNAGGALGFIDANGSRESRIRYLPRTPSLGRWINWGQPLITSDGRAVVVIDGLYPIGRGDVYVAQMGGYPTYCESWGVNLVQLAPEQNNLLVARKDGMSVYRPEDCGTDKAPVKVYQGIWGVISPNEKYFIEINLVGELGLQEPMIFIREIQTGKGKTVGPGNLPAWSRDGQWVAYTGVDGIYVVNATDDSKPRRIVAHQNPDKKNGYPFYHINSAPSLFFPPMVSWSPDGQWLVYSLIREGVGDDAIGNPSFYSIYKVNIVTGNETKIVDGGLSPYWRWPVKP